MAFIRTNIHQSTCSILFLSLILTVNCSYAQKKFNDSLILALDTISRDDEVCRIQLEPTISKYGNDSKELKDLYRSMQIKDSINVQKITAILDKYGWLSPGIIGDEGNATLFIVIQHSELPVQIKYLPMLRDAVNKGNAKARHLALLEDRVALRQGKEQVYGSQVAWDMKTNKHYVLPLVDPDNVDKRRAEVGLPPLSEYLQNWGTSWDPAQYKKDLPTIDTLYHRIFK
jgi:hypothetical protein